MLTPEQQQWIDSRSDTKLVMVVPYDASLERLFTNVKKQIETLVGSDVPIEHMGSSSLGISGQNEIDVQLPIAHEQFERVVAQLEPVFGAPKAVYPERVRFEGNEEGVKIDLAVIDKGQKNWRDALAFQNYLKTHPEALEEYRLLKEEASGFSVREYYRRKLEFINEILFVIRPEN